MWNWEASYKTDDCRSERSLLCLKQLINHANSLLGESTEHTKSSSLSHPASLCLLSCVCVFVLTCNPCNPPLHPLMQTYPGGRLIDSSAPLPLIPFSSLLPFHDDNTPPKKSTPCYVHLPFIFSPYNAFTYFFVLNRPWMSSYVHLHIWPQASSKLYTNYKHRNNFHISFCHLCFSSPGGGAK